MILLVVGLVIFLGVHLVRVIGPAWRERMVARLGEGPFKGLYSLVSLVGFVLIVWGFARASASPVIIYEPAFGLRKITALLVLLALILAFASSLPTGHIKVFVRHPLLIGTILFAIGHLLANGDLAGVVLFGAFLVWAVVDLVSALSRPAGPPSRPSWTADAMAVGIGVVVYGLFVWRIHLWLFGVSPAV